MPIYEYHCEKCGDFDVMQKITAGPLRKCPTCKSKVRKLMSNTAFQLKGTGWYVTDYGNKGSTNRTDSGSEGTSGGSSGSTSSESGSDSSSGSTDTKSEGKSKKPKSKSKGESAAA